MNLWKTFLWRTAISLKTQLNLLNYRLRMHMDIRILPPIKSSNIKLSTETRKKMHKWNMSSTQNCVWNIAHNFRLPNLKKITHLAHSVSKFKEYSILKYTKSDYESVYQAYQTYECHQSFLSFSILLKCFNYLMWYSLILVLI